jgi:hypothetical protein
MLRLDRSILLRFLPAVVAVALSPGAQACASCGCTLSSDWQGQGFSAEPGLKLDLRYDYLNQDQLRSGTGTISASAAAKLTTASGDPQEVERFTRNNYLTLGFDYALSEYWGINVQLPYIRRSHGTLGTGSDGSNPADGAYDSKTSGLGDIKVLGRYQGLTARNNFGVTFGLKLPTGSHTLTGTSTNPANPGDTAAIDRGLQHGTGTTDVIFGAYYFDSLNGSWDYFAQATVQAALNSRDQYKPGTGYNFNLGARYTGFEGVLPQIQLNTRHVLHDTGDNADQGSTGGTLVYLSPGMVVPLSKQASLYGFVQLPIYQDVRGVQLTPRYTVSAGVRYSF